MFLTAIPHNVFNARFVDAHVRSKAVEWLSRLEDDDICDFLPQLVQVCVCGMCVCMCVCGMWVHVHDVFCIF